MTRAEDLLQALNSLRKASERELSGEAWAGALQNVKELFRLAGFDGEEPGDGGGQSLTFAEALAAVRTQAEGELSGNAFYLASKILDNLASLSSVRISAPADPSEAQAPTPEQAADHDAAKARQAEAEQAPAAPSQPAPSGVSLDELAASAKARVDESAASLGVQVIHPYAAPPPDVYEQDAGQEHPEVQEHHDPFAGVEVEKRSSEPCFMPEIEPIVEQPASSVEPSIAVEVIEATSAREVAEATHDFGSPAAEAEPAPGYEAPRETPTIHAETPPVLKRLEAEAAAAAAKAAETLAQEAPAVAVSPEPAAASPASEAPPVIVKKIDSKPKEPKKEQERTFFSIWLEMLFGRRK